MKKDKLTIKAKKAKLRARSAYKLLEINKKFRLIKPNDDVLDLGCWPGGWMIVAKKIVNNGRVIGIDKKIIEPVGGCNFIKADILDDKILDKIKEKINKVDVVLSDLAPTTTGIKELDQRNSIDFCFRALFIASHVLKKNGNFLCKLFQSQEEKQFIAKIKNMFNQVRIYKPIASKKRSKEIYIMGLGFKS